MPLQDFHFLKLNYSEYSLEIDGTNYVSQRCFKHKINYKTRHSIQKKINK
jgi:hypothetical protein